MKIVLKHNKGFEWFISDELSFKGYFYVDDMFYEKENALAFLKKFNSIEVLKNFTSTLNGVFTILFKEENKVLIIADITRSFPLFFTYLNNTWLISDDIYTIKDKLEIPNFDALAETEFKASNHVHGSKTLLENVYQIQSSEYIVLNADEIVERNFYFNYAIDFQKKNLNNNLEKKCAMVFENAFQRFVKSLNNKKVIVPLSAGFDSRLIAVMLKKYDYKNVICYTYGKKNSFEIENSKKTAKALDFDWHFVEYNKDLIANYLDTEDFKNYAKFAGKLSAMPNLQEYFAVKYLKENKLVADDAIFVPGYAGDILGGSEYLNYIPENLSSKNIAKTILDSKLTNYTFDNGCKQQLLAEIGKNLFFFDNNYNQKIPATVFDNYNLKERIAKYIFNSANFYTYFGYEFRFPFWDRELLDFFKNIPTELKKNKQLFDSVLIIKYFKPFGVSFVNEHQPKQKNKKSKKIKNQLKPFLPKFIKEKKLAEKDWNNYQVITNEMLTYLAKQDVNVQRKYENYNEIITQWFLYFSKTDVK